MTERMNAIQDRLLDHMNDPDPTPAGVLATFEDAHATMREVAALVDSYREQPNVSVPDDLQQAIALGAGFGVLMQRVKAHLDGVTRRV